MRSFVAAIWTACVCNRRVTLVPLFDKPAFSRCYQLFQPRFVVHQFGKIVKRQVCQKEDEWLTPGLQRFVVRIVGKILKRQVCQKGGWVADGCRELFFPRLRTLVRSATFFVRRNVSIGTLGLPNEDFGTSKTISMGRFGTGVCHSSPFFRQSPFWTFRQIFEPQTHVEIFDEMFKMEIV